MKPRKSAFTEVRKHWRLYLMALPAVLSLFIFRYIPMGGLVMAFQRLDFKKGIFSSPFIGLQNFKFLFTTKDAWTITRNTVCYNIVFIVLDLVLAVALAIIMSELVFKRYSKALQTVYIMPYFLSMVVLSTVLYAFLSPTNGFLNNILQQMGRDPINWYNTKSPWPYILVIVRLYHTVGYSSIIYMAVISSIPNEYYEAAALDGATKLQQAKHITLPYLRAVICINLIRSVGHIFRADFGLFYTVPRDSGVLYPVTDVLDTYIYRGLKTLNNPGMSTAAGLYQSVVGFILVLVANHIVTKIDSDSAMF